MKVWQIFVGPAILALCVLLSQPSSAESENPRSDTMAGRTYDGAVVLLYPIECESRFPEIMAQMLQSPPYNSSGFYYAELWAPERREGQDLHGFRQEGCWALDSLTEEAFVYTQDGLKGIWEHSKLTPMHQIGVASLPVSPKVAFGHPQLL